MKTTIVTAFIPLGRNNWYKSSRSDERYFECFEAWSKLKNELIVYTTSECALKLETIKKKRLHSKTQIIIVNDYLSLDCELYSSIKKAMNNEKYKKYRYFNKNPEAIYPEYNYVMMLKYYFMKEASEMVKGNLMWLDFGYNHNKYYVKPNEFDYFIELENDNKIHLFYCEDLNDNPIFEDIRYTRNYFQGASFYGNTNLMADFYQLMRESQLNLNVIGLADQDQTILNIAYKRNPKMFTVHKIVSMGDLNVMTKNHFTVKSDKIKGRNVFKAFFKKVIYRSKMLMFRIRSI